MPPVKVQPRLLRLSERESLQDIARALLSRAVEGTTLTVLPRAPPCRCKLPCTHDNERDTFIIRVVVSSVVEE